MDCFSSVFTSSDVVVVVSPFVVVLSTDVSDAVLTVTTSVTLSGADSKGIMEGLALVSMLVLTSVDVCGTAFVVDIYS
jgi:hypothetical protein